MQMNDPYADEKERRIQRSRFWRGIVADTPTPIRDSIFGILLPVLCLIFDPGVFRGALACGHTMMPEYAIFVYTAVGFGSITLIAWNLFSNDMPRHVLGWVAGVFLMGPILILTLGVVFIPYSIVGLMFCIGVLGFFPFVTMFIYLRNFFHALQKYRRLGTRQPLLWLIVAILAGMLCALIVPVLAQWQLPQLVPGLQPVMVYGSCSGQ